MPGWLEESAGLCYNDQPLEVKALRCSCKTCGTYMVQAESSALGCVCPECGYRCRDCLGTDTVVSRDRLSALASDPRFLPENLNASFEEEPEAWEEEPDQWDEDGRMRR